MRILVPSGLVALGALSSFVACSGSKASEFGDYHPGYNETAGSAMLCAYSDPTVVREVAIGEAPVRATPTNVQPGVHALGRNDVVAEAKSAAIATLRSSSRPLRQIGSCELECHEVPRRPGGHSNGADAGSRGTPGSPSNGGMAPPSAGGDESGGAQQASTTNNQVAGVDEADFLKNDNQYFYVLSGNVLNILDAWPAESARVVATVPFPTSTPTKLFLGDNRLVVYSAVGGYAGYGGGECTYGYDCVPTGDGSTTRVTVLDITNRAAPHVLRELELSGALVAARKVGDAVHTVVYDAPLAEKLQGLAYAPAPEQDCYDRSDDMDAVVAAYRARIDAQAAQIEALGVDGPVMHDGDAAIEPEFRASNLPGDAFLSVLSIGMTSADVKAQTVMSKPGFVYASASALYVSVPHSTAEGNGWYGGWEGSQTASEVYKFSIGASPSATKFEASGIVKGSVLNQFAMDEWAGNLRIATTSGRVPDPTVHSTVTVLGQSGGALSTVGVVDDIAPTEDIRSVRFDGDRGFLVTFKKTDPLFAIDLANPAAPRVAGELKIPGFSTYMHFMDKTHLLAIGLEADDQGSFAYFNGIQLQIFDVNDLANPTLLHKEVIGTRGTTSEALTNHLGFNYFAPKNLLALPMTLCEGGGQGRTGDDLTFNGLLVYDVTVAGGFTKKGGIAHAVNQGVSCNNWWTGANSTVKRSVILDDFVYSVADDVINVANVSSLGTLTKSIPLQ